jgi:hypothetical protein
MASYRIDLIACGLLMVAGREGKAPLRMNSDDLFNAIYAQVVGVDERIEINFSEFEEAIDLLRDAGLARSSPEDEFVERFHRIDHLQLPNLVTQAKRENEAVLKQLMDGAVYSMEDATPTLDFLKKHPVFRHYADFGDSWLKGRFTHLLATAEEGVEDGKVETSEKGEEAAGPSIRESLSLKATISESEREQFRSYLQPMREEIESADLSQEQKADALAAVAAVDSLSDAPNPLWHAICVILSSPILSNVTALAALAISILAA